MRFDVQACRSSKYGVRLTRQDKLISARLGFTEGSSAAREGEDSSVPADTTETGNQTQQTDNTGRLCFTIRPESWSIEFTLSISEKIFTYLSFKKGLCSFFTMVIVF